MELKTAVELIEKGVSKADQTQSWTDLGAGNGLFTNALSTLLSSGSSIVAIDKKRSKITVAKGIHLDTIISDFLDLDFENVDGVLMANALHYVKDQADFLKKLSSKTKRIVLVEYDTDSGNLWVPYPISFNKLKSMYPNAEQIGHAPSSYQKHGIYSALILTV